MDELQRVTPSHAVIHLLSNNSGRRVQFRTKTWLERSEEKLYVRKSAQSQQAWEFLQGVVKREPMARAFLSQGHFYVLCGKTHDYGIRYDYVAGKSLQDLIRENLLKSDFGAADDLFETFVRNVITLPSLNCVPEEFYDTLGTHSRADLQKLDCIKPGLIDLIPRNIIISDNKWVVVDNEWVFDFPVPRVFIIFRALQKLAIVMQPALLRCASESVPLIGLFSIGLRTYYLPQAWARYITSPPQPGLKTLLRWEMDFQQYVTGKYPAVGRAKSRPKTVTFYKHNPVKEHLKKSAAFFKAIPGLTYSLRLFERRLACSNQKNI